MDYIGIDLHKATSQVCIVSEHGELTEFVQRVRELALDPMPSAQLEPVLELTSPPPQPAPGAPERARRTRSASTGEETAAPDSRPGVFEAPGSRALRPSAVGSWVPLMLLKVGPLDAAGDIAHAGTSSAPTPSWAAPPTAACRELACHATRQRSTRSCHRSGRRNEAVVR